jgi:ABC-type dipeptide/oligopeptide/nickel transport system permease subunit
VDGAPAGPSPSPASPRPPRWRGLTHSGPVVAGVAVLALLAIVCAMGPSVARHGPLESDFVRGVSAASTPVGPCRDFPLGADRLFRDVFARLAAAGRLSLSIAVGATAVAATLGTVVGIVSGWCASGPARIVDDFLMRTVDVLLALPFLLLVMAIGAAMQETSALTILVILGVTGWLGLARIVRAKTLQVCTFDYVEASRALGQSTGWVVLRHVLPNISGTIVVTATTQMAQMVVADSALGYLGVGISPPTPTWGRMLAEGQDYYLVAPWLVAAPGVAIFLAVWGFNMLGEGLRDALDPRES